MSRPGFLPSSSVDVAVHVYETSTIGSTVHAAEHRATVRLGGSGGQVTVFADRGELVRLRDALAEVVAELDAARARLAAELSRELTGTGAVAV
ncbi:MAG: hypothetical protein AB7I38_19000 [Dehalococcoidia bacterium]